MSQRERERDRCRRYHRRETCDSDDVTGKMMSQEERQVMSDSKTEGFLSCQTGRDREQ